MKAGKHNQTNHESPKVSALKDTIHSLLASNADIAVTAGLFAMKMCSTCKQTKPLSEFHKGRNKKDGHQHVCKICCSIYRRTAKCKASYRRYKQSKKGKANAKRYRTRHPLQKKAKNAVSNAVNNAIRTGKLPRPDTLLCMNCFEQAEDYHHPRYEKEHWLDVFPVCKKCHRKIHFINRSG